MEDIIGKQLGPYRILERLGEGGMATVFLAYQASVDREIALKVLPRQLAADANFLGRFEQEARLVAHLQHPHILPVFDYGESDGYTYIAMPYIRNGTLAEQLTGQPWSLKRVERLTRQLAGALDYAHAQGLVHRDIKPSNVLIDDSGNYLLTDFGIAKLYESSAQFTRTGGILGTPAYMSPEQGLGEPLDRRSDIYSLGIVLYELLTGRVPFSAETPIATVFKHINDPLPPPREFNNTLPKGMEHVIYKALAKSPGDRFQSAGELADAYQRAEHDPSEDTAETVIDRVPAVTAGSDGGRKIPRWLLAAAVALLLLIGGISIVGGMRVVEGRHEAEAATQAAEMAFLIETATAMARQEASPTSAGEPLPALSPTETGLPEPTVPQTAETVSPPTAVPTIPPTIEPSRVDLPGNGLVQVSFDSEESYTPSFSDDQRFLLASSEIDGFWRVTRYDTLSNERRVLTQQSADFWNPQPSSDGLRALVSSDLDDPEGHHDIFLMNLENGSLIERLTDAPGDDVYAQWLPDESGFVFLSYRDGGAEVWLQRFDGSGARQLTDNADGVFDGFADVSPDGQWLAFQSNRDGNHEIYIMGIDGSNPRRLTFDDARDAAPTFSPDGQWIAFESARDGDYDIWAIRTNGQDLFNVTNSSERDQVPAFSPDGRWLAFQSDRDGDWDIYRIPWPYAPISPFSQQASWPVSNTGVEACHLSPGDSVTAGENTRFWSEPNVLTGSGILAVDPGTTLIIETADPIWGPVRRDIDASGWWWEVKDSQGSSGWVWQGRLVECAEEGA
jgi:serine/threonine protein kinase